MWLDRPLRHEATPVNRAGKLALAQANQWADHVESRLSVVSCIAACDVVHTMTSLTGFDALLRGKRVVVYGQPFYAGWGLTDDVLQDGAAFARRQRRLSMDELVAGIRGARGILTTMRTNRRCPKNSQWATLIGPWCGAVWGIS